MAIFIKRVYEEPGSNDGKRILVDRLWPRGLSKSEANVDLWLKEVAPSNELRKWFNHDPKKWQDFRRRYLKELASNETALNQLRAYTKEGACTLLYAAKDTSHNNAVVIKEFIDK